MTPKVLEGKIKNGRIIPKKTLPKNMSDIEVRIILIPQKNEASKRIQYRGSIPHGWGDPLKYQRKIRTEWERKSI